MRKNGFTLTEILAVLVIISLLVLIMAPSFMNQLKSSKSDAENSEREIIFSAVETLIDADEEQYPLTPGNVYCITIKELIDNGKLVEPLKSIITNEEYDDNTAIKVVVGSQGTKDFSMDNDGTCSQVVTNDIVFDVVPDNKTWSQSKSVTVYYPKLGDGYTNKYKINDENLWHVASSSGNGYKLPNFTANGIAYAKTEKGDQEITKEQKVERIDRLSPQIIKVVKGEVLNQTQQLSIVMTDAGSGVAAYYVGTSSTKPAVDATSWTEYKLPSYGGIGTATVSKNVGTYYVYVKDKAGNISEGRKIVVENLEPPTCTIFLNPSNPDGDNNWYTSNVNLSMSMTGAPTVFGLATSSQSENGKNSATHTSDGTSITYYGYVKGPTGTDTCSKTFKLDKSAPAISTASKIATKNNLTITLSDATSGLAGYTITTTASTPTSWTAISGASFTKTFSLTTGTHYVHVKDKAGNTTYKAVAITALDPPTCAISLDPGSPNGNDNWYTKDVTINMTTSGVVSEKGLATSSGSTNGLTQVVHSTDSNGVVYYGFVKNAAGANSCTSSSFKIDKTPPYVNLTGVSWEKIDGSVVSDGCQNINNASGNRTCNIRIRINSGTRYSWSSNRYPVDSGSGVDTSSSTSNGEYAMWTHNGEQPQYTSWNNWSDRQSWNWRCGTCTWLNYSFYYVDKAGNVGPTMTIHFDVEHY